MKSVDQMTDQEILAAKAAEERKDTVADVVMAIGFAMMVSALGTCACLYWLAMNGAGR